MNGSKFDFKTSFEGEKTGITVEDGDRIVEIMERSEHVDCCEPTDHRGMPVCSEEMVAAGKDYETIWCHTRLAVLSVEFLSKSRFYLYVRDSVGNEELDFWKGVETDNPAIVRIISRLFISKVVEKIGIPFEINDKMEENGESVGWSDRYEFNDIETLPQRLEGTFNAVEDAVEEMVSTRAKWFKDAMSIHKIN